MQFIWIKVTQFSPDSPLTSFMYQSQIILVVVEIVVLKLFNKIYWSNLFCF